MISGGKLLIAVSRKGQGLKIASCIDILRSYMGTPSAEIHVGEMCGREPRPYYICGLLDSTGMSVPELDPHNKKRLRIMLVNHDDLLIEAARLRQEIENGDARHQPD